MRFTMPWILEHPADITDTQWLIVRSVGFAVLLFIVVRFIVPALRTMLDARRQTIEETAQQVADTMDETARARDDYKDRLEHVADEAERRLAEAVEDAERMTQDIVNEGRKQADMIIAQTRTELNRERERAMAHLRIEYAEDVIEAARYAARQTLTEARHAELVRSFIRDIEARS